MSEAERWINELQLRPHPEGGYFRETYRCNEVVPRAHLPSRFRGDRSFSTAIYFLLEGADFSALHRIQQDEVWHHYDGSSLTVDVISPDGNHSAILLGKNVGGGERPQTVVKAGCLFGASLNDARSYALVGCSVAPGFEFDDFTLPGRDELLDQYPQHRHVIERLTR
jgi:predicted cupin superfamily sugar epimerase